MAVTGPVASTTPARPPRPLPPLSLPVKPQRIAPSAAVSLALHAAIVGALLWVGATQLDQHNPQEGTAGGEREGVGGRPAVNFFALTAPAPAAVDVPATPAVQLSTLPALDQIHLALPRLEAAPDSAAAAALARAAGTGKALGQGFGSARTGTGLGIGSSGGPGIGREGDYIVVASPRTAILPPLSKVPGSVAGRTYRIRFWVAADGRVTRVEVDPPIPDDGYRREFLERMMAYRFYPARTRDGANVASVVAVPLRIGN